MTSCDEFKQWTDDQLVSAYWSACDEYRETWNEFNSFDYWDPETYEGLERECRFLRERAECLRVILENRGVDHADLAF